MAYSAMNVDTPFDVILHDGSDTFIITALRNKQQKGFFCVFSLHLLPWLDGWRLVVELHALGVALLGPTLL